MLVLYLLHYRSQERFIQFKTTVEDWGGSVAHVPVDESYRDEWPASFRDTERYLALLLIGRDPWKKLVYGITLNDASLPENWHALLQDFDNLDTVELHNTTVADSSLRFLANNQGLKYLDLSQTHISDTALQYLTTLQHLEYLNLRGTRISDAGITLVSQCPSLRWLDFSDTLVTGSRLGDLKRLTYLQGVYLENLSLTYTDGLAALSEVPALRAIHLAGTPISDAQLSQLSRSRSLRHLGLGGVACVPFQGLAALSKSECKLVSLDIYGASLRCDDFELIANLHLKRLGVESSMIQCDISRIVTLLPETEVFTEDGVPLAE